MHFLFIASWLGPIGGTETLVARMSKWLLNKGHTVTLLTNSVRGCRSLLPSAVSIRELDDQFLQLCFCRAARKAFADLRLERPDVIKAFDLPASWIASVLSSGLSPAPKVVFGNYYPYVIPESRNPLKHAMFKLFLLNLRRNFNDESILCMSKEQISEFKLHYGAHRNPKFWPLPVEDPSLDAPPRAPRFGHIVSIGRLAPMKEYNLYMIDIIARLRQQGYPVRWTVYGQGDFAGPMKTRIAELGLEGAVELKGTLPYAQFAEALHDAYLFVGMGTASVEAALCGVPTVVALAHDTTGITYGPLYRFTFGNVGERMDAEPSSTVQAEIERVLKLSVPEYQAEVVRTHEYAGRYEMDATMERFLVLASDASPPRASEGLYYRYYLQHLAKKLFGRRTASVAVQLEQT
jgi:glycosyltransferase involved in cell wall biosynthesis